jgi:hypothetical protein
MRLFHQPGDACKSERSWPTSRVWIVRSLRSVEGCMHLRMALANARSWMWTLRKVVGVVMLSKAKNGHDYMPNGFDLT